MIEVEPPVNISKIFTFTADEIGTIYGYGNTNPLTPEDKAGLINNWLKTNNHIPIPGISPALREKSRNLKVDAEAYLQQYGIVGGEGGIICLDPCDTAPGCIHLNTEKCDNMTSCENDCPSLDDVIQELGTHQGNTKEFDTAVNPCGWTEAFVKCDSEIITDITNMKTGDTILHDYQPIHSMNWRKSKKYKPQYYKGDYCTFGSESRGGLYKKCIARGGPTVVSSDLQIYTCQYDECYTTDSGERVPARVVMQKFCMITKTLEYSNWCVCATNPPCSQVLKFPVGEWLPYGPPLAPDNIYQYQNGHVLRYGKNGDITTENM